MMSGLQAAEQMIGSLNSPVKMTPRALADLNRVRIDEAILAVAATRDVVLELVAGELVVVGPNENTPRAEVDTERFLHDVVVAEPIVDNPVEATGGLRDVQADSGVLQQRPADQQFISLGQIPLLCAPTVIGAVAVPFQLTIKRSPEFHTHPRLSRNDSPGCRSASLALDRVAHAESSGVPSASSEPAQSMW